MGTYTYDATHKHAVASTSGGWSYQYDANGNMTRRDPPGSDYYDFVYDAENRIYQAKKNGSVIATFTYDGDGARVKAVQGSSTTIFVGSHYEKTGSTVTKYYLAGGQRVAMRQAGTVYWLVGDHLGSTSVVANQDASVHSRQLYKPWGETRFTSGTLPTKYTYTGQYSYVSDFGLHFYNARWYDSSLGRFAQADTVTPGGVQGLDRYAYVNNNSVNGIDPSGHGRESTDCGPDGVLCDDDDSNDYDYAYIPQNGLGRHLTAEEKLALAVLIMGETSTWRDTGYLNWIIWGLLNLISLNPDRSLQPGGVYNNWKNEERCLITGGNACGTAFGAEETLANWAMSYDEFEWSGDPNSASAQYDMLLFLSGKYETEGLSDQFEQVKNLVNSVDAQWFGAGPNSSADPTHGGVGHMKYALTTDEQQAREDRKSYSNNHAYSAVSEVYQTSDGYWTFVFMNRWPE